MSEIALTKTSIELHRSKNDGSYLRTKVYTSGGVFSQLEVREGYPGDYINGVCFTFMEDSFGVEGTGLNTRVGSTCLYHVDDGIKTEEEYFQFGLIYNVFDIEYELYCELCEFHRDVIQELPKDD